MSPEEIEAHYGQYYEQGEKVRTEHVSRLNYSFSACFMNIGRYKLFELFPSRGGGTAEHSFLCIEKSFGVMIPDPFYQHRLRIKAMSPPVPKRSPANFQPAPQKKVDPHPEKRRRKESRRALPKNEDKPAAVDRWAI